MKADNKTARFALGRRIKEERQRLKLTQHELATAANLSDKFISNIERGSRQPTLKTLQMIAGALRISPRDLYSDVPAVHQPIDTDMAQMASILRDASAEQRATALRVVRSLIKQKK